MTVKQPEPSTGHPAGADEESAAEDMVEEAGADEEMAALDVTTEEYELIIELLEAAAKLLLVDGALEPGAVHSSLDTTSNTLAILELADNIPLDVLGMAEEAADQLKTGPALTDKAVLDPAADEDTTTLELPDTFA